MIGEPAMPAHSDELPPLQFESLVLRPLFEGKLRIDCTKISLTGTINGKPMEFTGPGYITQMKSTQEESTGFAITIFMERQLTITDASPPVVLEGTLLKASDTLTAIDELGRNWHAENIRMTDPSGCVGGVLRASCHELVLSRRSLEGNSIEVWSRGELRLPTTTVRRLPIIEQPAELSGRRYVTTVGADTFQSCGFDFAAFHHDGNTGMRAMGNQSLPPNIGSRVWESMLFALAGPLNWSAIKLIDQGTEELRIRSPRGRPSSNGDSPILSYLYPPPYDTWKIFDCYLRYVLKVGKKTQPSPPAKLHPLSSQVFAVCNARGLSIEAQSLALTVAVENVLNTFFTDRGNPVDADVTALCELAKHIENWSTENQEPRKRAKNRVKGAISGFQKAGAGDRIHALLSANAITDAGREAWKELRNPAAHGDWPELRQNHQRWADWIGAVRTLFHQLIFHLIGYKGTYTDYGTPGYPLGAYPPSPATGAVPDAPGAP